MTHIRLGQSNLLKFQWTAQTKATEGADAAALQSEEESKQTQQN
jgi:hypothetical protein